MGEDLSYALRVSLDSLAQIHQNFAFTECLPRLGLPEPIEITPVTTIALFEIVFVLLPFQCFLIKRNSYINIFWLTTDIQISILNGFRYKVVYDNYIAILYNYRETFLALFWVNNFQTVDLDASLNVTDFRKRSVLPRWLGSESLCI